ncbi:AAA family ATPase [Candidatus Odyssella thessalonicensis]|uniref:AAA family ATPase n=1 Tax=Candidatus Odyssella thessalonicensis TaxID=84647 RepID=UPI000225B77F|nr:AAA family ATPase [Candidatus Odyssella thessalonicensis]
MAIYHAHIKTLGRSDRNTVGALAYRSGTRLQEERTGELFNYRNKAVDHVELMIPENAPQWAQDLKTLIAQDREKGVQKLSNLAEFAEKRIDAQVYKDFEFALPAELTSEQNIALFREFIQDQFCKRGITVLTNFHNDYDKNSGQNKPHCHAVLLTRELTEKGLSKEKNRTWNQTTLLEEWREQLAAYTNFHLQLHGHQARIDHRSYEERGIDIEAQPKLSRSVQEMEGRLKDISSLSMSQPQTDKAQEFNFIKLKNMYRIMKQPDLVFKIVHKSQSTFMWGDVQKVLARYLDDPEVFQAYEVQLRNSPELKLLRETQEGHVYTTKTMLKKELNLIERAHQLSQDPGFQVTPSSVEKHLQAYNEKYAAKGGLTVDQKEALAHIVDDKKLVAVVGYAGTGKSSILTCAQEIWKDNGYKVYGLAPTGKAAQNLQNEGIKSMTVHRFLQQYHQGRSQFNEKSVLILDEAGMVDISRFEELLGAVQKLGVKLVTVGDGRQLQPIEAGAAFRLVTRETGVAKLETIIRQNQAWMKEATQHFGRGETEAALQKYHDQDRVKIVDEPLPSIQRLAEAKNYVGLVEAFNTAVRSQKLVGWTFRSGLELNAVEKERGNGHLEQWKRLEVEAAQAIAQNIDDCRPALQILKTDPYRLAAPLVTETDPPLQKYQVQRLVQQWGLDGPRRDGEAFICQPKHATQATLMRDWHASIQAEPHKSHVLMAFTLKETEALNEQARLLRIQDGAVDKQSFTHTIMRLEENDFGDQSKLQKQRAFSKGDRLLFMKNDQGLGVRNGMLGTIEEINPTKLKVRLDGKDGKQGELVSFASKLYPYFDLGWAININKQQGATNDKSFILASNHFHSNLSYVALTRHREDAYIYGSAQEFWTEGILIKQLSKQQEKLSSLDYIDTNQALKLIREESSIIREALEKVTNTLKAIHYTAKRSLNHWLHKDPQFEAILVETDPSEAQRAKTLNQDKGLTLDAPPSPHSEISLPTPEAPKSWKEMLADLEKQDMEKRIFQATGKTLQEYQQAKDQFFQAVSRPSLPQTPQASWQEVLNQLLHPESSSSGLSKEIAAQSDSGKVDYRSQSEKDIDLFKESYQAYKQSEREGTASTQELSSLQEQASIISKNETTMWYLSVRNPELRLEIQNLTKEHDQQKTLIKDNSLSR